MKIEFIRTFYLHASQINKKIQILFFSFLSGCVHLGIYTYTPAISWEVQQLEKRKYNLLLKNGDFGLDVV